MSNLHLIINKSSKVKLTLHDFNKNPKYMMLAPEMVTNHKVPKEFYYSFVCFFGPFTSLSINFSRGSLHPLCRLPRPWLCVLYPNVTNVSHQQPHGPTFKTTALTVPHHFHLLVHHACVSVHACVWWEWGWVCVGVCVCVNVTHSCQNAVETLIASSLQERSLQDRHWLSCKLLNVEERRKVGSKVLISLFVDETDVRRAWEPFKTCLPRAALLIAT